METPKRHRWRRSGVLIVNFEHISHLVLVFLLLTLSNVTMLKATSHFYKKTNVEKRSTLKN